VSGEGELSAAPGFIDPGLTAELPGLRLKWLTVDVGARRSPPAVRRRLRDLSSRYRGDSVVAMRTHAVPHAYRAFFHQIGLDPDATRIPSEQAAVERLLHGGFRSSDLVTDARLIALVETGVPVWALDAEVVDPGGLGIRTTVAGERLGRTEDGDYLPPGRLVVADAACIHALLFGDVARGHAVRSRTRRTALYAVAVEGVPAIHLEEALWACVEVLRDA
jgi:DNA/RNA-binding domain of Phe-tRNA-synthetase-like protein